MGFNKITCSLALFILLLTSGFSQEYKSAITKTSKVIVRILTKKKEKDNFVFSGTGWVFQNSNEIVTAKHVVEGDMEKGKVVPNFATEVIFDDNETIICDDIRLSSNTDIAIMILGEHKHQGYLMLSNKNVELGDPVTGIGFGLGFLKPLAFTGIISGEVRAITYSGTKTTVNLWGMNAQICPGHSGSPVVDLNGDIIGLAVAASCKYPSLNWFVPKDDIAKEVKILEEQNKTSNL
jgi:S1-C subfamily serine protease